MPDVKIVSRGGKVKERFSANIHYADADGALALLRRRTSALNLGSGARIEVKDKHGKWHTYRAS